MIQKTSMTIDAYLCHAGLKTAGKTGRKQFIPLKTGPNSVFSDNLTSAISSNPSGSIGKSAGLTIADYLNQATAGVSHGLFGNSTIHGASNIHADRLNRLSPAPAMPKGNPTAVDSASQDCSIRADAEIAAATDSEALIADSINRAAKRYHLPEKLIASVIQAESNFRVNAVSPAGAQGLMQLMPATAKELGVADPFDVRQNIEGGAAYLRKMLDRFDGDVKLALAAYNAGPGTVEKYNGNVPYRETQNYIERVLKRFSA